MSDSSSAGNKYQRLSFPPGFCHTQELGQQKRGRACPTRPFSQAAPRPAGASETERTGKRGPHPGGCQQEERQCPQRAPREPCGTRGRVNGRPCSRPCSGIRPGSGRCQVAAVWTARAVTWLAPDGSTGNGGKWENSWGRALPLRWEWEGSAQFSRGF